MWRRKGDTDETNLIRPETDLVSSPADGDAVTGRVKTHKPRGSMLRTADNRPVVTEVAFDQDRLRRSLVLLLVIISFWLTAVWVFFAVSHFLFLLLLAWLLSIAMEPTIGFLIRHGMKRGAATAVTGGSGIVTFIVVAALFGTQFVNQLAGLIQSLPDLVTQSVNWVNQTFHTNLDASAIAAKLNVGPDQVASVASGLAGGVLGWAGSLVSVIFDLFTVIVFMFYFAGAGPRILQAVAVWMPPERQRVIGTVWQIATEKTGGYVISKVVLAGLSAFFHGIFFWAIGVPFWLPMALLVGITSQFVPLVGVYIGIAIPVIVSVFEKPLNAVWIIVFSTIYQQIETYFFTPKVSRRTMDVNPILALAGVFVGAAVWGPLGALIGIPLAAAIVAVAETYGRRYELVPGLTVEFADDDEVTEDVGTNDVASENAHGGAETKGGDEVKD